MFSIHNHTENSNQRLKDSIIKTSHFIDAGVKKGYKGLVVTDHESLTSHIKLNKEYVSRKKKGEIPSDFKLALGNEIYLIDSIEKYKNNNTSEKNIYYHFLLVAKNEIGHRQLRMISSNSWRYNYVKTGKMERVPTEKSFLKNNIEKYGKNIIGSTACLGGEFANLVLKHYKLGIDSKKEIANLINYFIDIFGKENFFIEIQPTKQVYNEDGTLTDQALFNQKAVKLAEYFGLDYIVTTDSHYIDNQDAWIHEAYLTSDDTHTSQREVKSFYDNAYMMELEEINKYLINHLDKECVIKSIENTIKIYNMIEDYELKMDTIVPTDKKAEEFELKHLLKDWYDKYKYVKIMSESNFLEDRRLLFKCELGLLELNEPIDDTTIGRIDNEFMELIETSKKINQHVSSYYTMVETLVNKIMWEISYVGVARGSVTGFYIAYLLKITQINPLKYNLPSWRHLTSTRPELPDIDLDSESSKRQNIFKAMKEYYGFDNVLNIMTERTEGSKSTVLTCCRGLGINDDEATELANIIPIERGQNWDLVDVMNGNVEKDRKPIKSFIEKAKKFDGLIEAMLKIEGLISGRSVHASGVFVFDNGYIEQNSLMRAPNGSFITCWNMKDSEYMGGLKVDCLTIKALDKIHKTIDILIDEKIIEDCGSIRKNYDKYVHPKNIEETKSFWNILKKGQLMDAFQFDTDVGSVANKKVQPNSIYELASANSLMRLSNPQGEQPVDTYVRFKNDISQWYGEMKGYGLSDNEIQTLEKHLLKLYGVADTQESMMELSMDKKIGGFDLVWANKLRKAVAKKDEELMKVCKETFFSNGLSLGNSKKILGYVWDVQIQRQLGYSFSLNHTIPYSVICMQEIHLANKYGELYWNTSCLSINASADENNEDNSNTDYGKIAKAICDIQESGNIVSLPDINESNFGFRPYKNTILFGLKAINGIGDDIAEEIIKNRPYKNLDDFMIKNPNIRGKKMSLLIKSGAFDTLYESRIDVMNEFIIKEEELPKKLTLSHLENIEDLMLLSEVERKNEYRYYKYRKYIYNKEFAYDSKMVIIEPKYALPYFYEMFESKMKENKDYFFIDNNLVVKKTSFDREYKKLMCKLVSKISSEDFYKKFCEEKIKKIGYDNKEIYLSTWEKESINFYFHKHELNYFDLPLSDEKNIKQTKIVGYNGDYPRYELCSIGGMIVNKDKNKHMLDILTQFGVFKVKFHKNMFIKYDKNISETVDGKKVTLEKGWLQRGNLIKLTGYYLNGIFRVKTYFDSIYKNPVELIEIIDDTIKIKDRRINS